MELTRTADRPHGPGCCCTPQCTAEWRSNEPEDSHQGQGGGERDEVQGGGSEDPRRGARHAALLRRRQRAGAQWEGGRIRSWILVRWWWGCGTAASATRSSSTSACQGWAGTAVTCRVRSWSWRSGVACMRHSCTRQAGGRRWRSRRRRYSASASRRRPGRGPAIRCRGRGKGRRGGRRRCLKLPPQPLPGGAFGGRGGQGYARGHGG